MKRRNPAAKSMAEEIKSDGLIALAAERVELPDVPMRLDYQDDVDTLCIRFEGNVSSSLLSETDESENGVIGIYEGKKLVGLEILDITGQLEHANPI